MQKIIPQAIPNQVKLMNHLHLSKMYPQSYSKEFVPNLFFLTFFWASFYYLLPISSFMVKEEEVEEE